ncbi:DUF983 domain-containing protein [Dyadobacter tibetensis]|uniref:DUF983 domain-containing protein n=1 Tax=Dyadobacter tibetensis TaxID=1211851 RepID=UPI000472E734|nr:DUF983 domain-containing protein [Dyadobacter tibetensis]
MASTNKLITIFTNKCPRCGEGDFFISKSAYTRNFDKMHKRCAVCNENFVPEPGFYQGALYVSYALNVAFMLVYFLIFVNFFDDYLNYFLVSIIPLMILLTPWFYRLARRAWLAIFTKPQETSGKGYRS